MANQYTVLSGLQKHLAQGGVLMRPADPDQDWLDPLTGKIWPRMSCEKAPSDGLMHGRGDSLFPGLDQTFGAPLKEDA